MKSFFLKNRLVLSIVFVLIGTLFMRPFTVYSVDSDYLWHAKGYYYISSSFLGYDIRVEPDKNVEIVAFAERGALRSPTSADTARECRYTVEQLKQSPRILYRYPQELLDNVSAVESFPTSYADYLGVIVKENGCVVSASLYKFYGFTDYHSTLVEEIAILEYPFLNCFVTETYARHELQRIAAADRVITHNSLTDYLYNRLFTANWTDSQSMFNWQPPHSPTYNP